MTEILGEKTLRKTSDARMFPDFALFWFNSLSTDHLSSRSGDQTDNNSSSESPARDDPISGALVAQDLDSSGGILEMPGNPLMPYRDSPAPVKKGNFEVVTATSSSSASSGEDLVQVSTQLSFCFFFVFLGGFVVFVSLFEKLTFWWFSTLEICFSLSITWKCHAHGPKLRSCALKLLSITKTVARVKCF